MIAIRDVQFRRRHRRLQLPDDNQSGWIFELPTGTGDKFAPRGPRSARCAKVICEPTATSTAQGRSADVSQKFRSERRVPGSYRFKSNISLRIERLVRDWKKRRRPFQRIEIFI